nr:MAG TPA: hypothetical protein [Caudoviricetes sp.]
MFFSLLKVYGISERRKPPNAYTNGGFLWLGR